MYRAHFIYIFDTLSTNIYRANLIPYPFSTIHPLLFYAFANFTRCREIPVDI